MGKKVLIHLFLCPGSRSVYLIRLREATESDVQVTAEWSQAPLKKIKVFPINCKVPLKCTTYLPVQSPIV